MIFQPLSPRMLTVTTDLSLILFLVCAAALQDDPAAPAAAATAATGAPDTPIMMSVWSDAPGAISLAQWLAEQPPDDSQRLSIEISYRAGHITAAFVKAQALRQSAGAAGANARVLISEGERDAAMAQLVQDHAAPVVGEAATGPDIALQ